MQSWRVDLNNPNMNGQTLPGLRGEEVCRGLQDLNAEGTRLLTGLGTHFSMKPWGPFWTWAPEAESELVRGGSGRHRVVLGWSWELLRHFRDLFFPVKSLTQTLEIYYFIEFKAFNTSKDNVKRPIRTYLGHNF